MVDCVSLEYSAGQGLFCANNNRSRFGYLIQFFSALNADGGFSAASHPTSNSNTRKLPYSSSLSPLDLWLCPPPRPHVFQSLFDTGVMGRHNKGLPCGMGDP